MKRQQQGFTLIELVIVIVILGILSAFALPRFADLGDEARTATLSGANGSVKSAASIAHAQWLAGGETSPIDLDGTDITMSDDGYPTSDDAGIGLAAQLSDEFTLTPGADVNADTATIELDASPNICQFTYDPTDGTTTLDNNNDC